MRIMQINSSWGWSGGQNQVLHLSLGLQERGHSVVVIANEGSELSRRAEAKGLYVQHVYMKKEYNIGATFKLRKMMKEMKIDVAHAHKPVPFSLASPAASMAKIPVFVVSRRVSFPIGRNIFSAWKWRNYRIDGLIGVSEQIRDGLIKFGFPEDKVIVAYSSTDTNVFHPGYSGDSIREEFGISRDTKVVTKIANYFEWKGYEIFLRAAAFLVKKVPFINFLCVGHRNKFFPRMKQLAQQLGIEEQVIFTGFRTDIPEIIAASDVTVNCAIRGEGLAGVLRESLAMDVPVVAADAGGNRELVQDRLTGRLVPVADVEATAMAILDTLNDPAEAGLMASRGRARVIEEFTNDAMLDKTIEFYEKLYLERQFSRK